MYVRRLNLNDLYVSGPRKQVRGIVRMLVVGLAALAAAGFTLERHRVSGGWYEDARDWGPVHTLLSDTGPWPIVVMLFLGLAQLWGHKSRMLLGLLNAIASLAMAFLALMGVVLAHLLSRVDHVGSWGTVLPISLIGLMCACVAQIVVEPWVAAAERRAIEWPQPELPSAVVVRGR